MGMDDRRTYDHCFHGHCQLQLSGQRSKAIISGSCTRHPPRLPSWLGRGPVCSHEILRDRDMWPVTSSSSGELRLDAKKCDSIDLVYVWLAREVSS